MKTEITCTSCGQPIDGHLGMEGTCAKLQQAKSALRKIDQLAGYGDCSMVGMAKIIVVCKHALAEIDPPKPKRKGKV